MTNTLASPDDLSGFPGAPFTAGVVDGAVGGLRSVARWHIAPSITETLTLDCDGGTRVVLPSLHVTAVTAVRDLSGSTPAEITGFRWSKAGILFRAGGWPCGFQVLEVDIVHGYAECPPELLPAIAAACQSVGVGRHLASKGIGPFTESYRDSTGQPADPAVQRYTLPSRP